MEIENETHQNWNHCYYIGNVWIKHAKCTRNSKRH